MPITLGSNIASLRGQNGLNKVTSELRSVYERLSSGQRINRASDDAAGLAISESLKTDTRIFTQAIRNINDGISLGAIAEGALQSLVDITIRQKELAEQAANGVYTHKQRKALDNESAELTKEFNRIIETTSFNNINIFSDNGTGIINIEAGFGGLYSININTQTALKRTVGNGNFDTETDAPGVTKSSLMADINGDGNLDMLYSSTGVHGVQVSLNDGTGVFGALTDVASGLNILSLNLTTGDFDGDGDTDIAGTRFDTNQFFVLRNNGGLSFTQTQSTNLSAGIGSTSRNIYSGDFTGDGSKDLLVIRADGSATSGYEIWQNNGNGNFSLKQTASAVIGHAGTAYAVNATAAVGDVDNDGDLDFASAGKVFLNNNGTFNSGTQISGTNTLENADTLADLNGDGNLDYIFTRARTGIAGQNYVGVSYGNGDGTFQAEQRFNSQLAGTTFQNVAVLDANNDGFLDIAARDSTNGMIEIFLNDKNGALTSTSTVASTGGSFNRHISAGDIDGDGRDEIVTSNGTHQGQTTQTTQAQRYNLYSQNNAKEALDQLTEQLNRITNTLGQIGADQSRLSVAESVLQAQSENYSTARARINDADIAEESSKLVRNRILQQAASSILGQANLQPELALRLLS